MVGMDTGTPAPICGHTYTTKGQRRFHCTAAPHPRRPDEHYFERVPGDPEPEGSTHRGRSLIVIPGQRRG